MEQERDCQTIYFKDLFFAAVYKWKLALVAALIFTLILGCFGLYQSKKNINLNTATISPENQLKIQQLEELYASSKAGIETQSKYLDNSILMEIDPYNAYTSVVFLYAYPHSLMNAQTTMPVTDNTSAILRAYRATLSDSAVMQKIAEVINMDSIYLLELISYDFTANALSITTRGRTPEEARKIADILLKAAISQQDAINTSIETHDIDTIAYDMGPRIDTSLYEIQTAAQQRLRSLQNSMISSEAELNKLQPTKLLGQSANPVLLAIIGCILGILLAVIVAWTGHFGSEKIYSARILTNQTGVRVLGCVCGQRKYDPITRWLRKWEGRSSECTCSALPVDIRNRCKNFGLLLIVGHYSTENISFITKELEAAGITCVTCGALTNDPSAMETLPDCDGVLLVQTCHTSRYTDVEQAMQTTEDYNKPLIGCVLIDG